MSDAYRALALEHVPFAFVDVETTGLDPRQGHRMCEIAIIRTVGRVETRQFSTLLNPGRPISPGAQSVNGITRRMVADAPRFAEMADDVQGLLENTVIVAHNVPFDLGFINEELRLNRRVKINNLSIDTLVIARRAFRFARNSLDALTTQLGLAETSQHRALADVRAVKGLLWRLVDDLGVKGIRTLGDLLDIQNGQHLAISHNDSVPTEIIEAIRVGGTVQLNYQSGGGSLTNRRVDPIRVDERLGRQYLVAYCHLRQAERSFRLDRIKKIDVTNAG